MTTITKYLVLLILSVATVSNAQEKSKDSSTTQSLSYKQSQIAKLEASKQQIEADEKEQLKAEVAAINKRLDNKELTPDEAMRLKKEAAKKRAANIQDRIAITDAQIALLGRNSLEEVENTDSYVFRIGKSGKDGENGDSFIFFGRESKDKPRKYDRRTTSDIVFAIGFNNALIEGQNLDDSPYKIGGSGFVELGYAWKTRVFNNSNFLRLKYGVSIQWNKLNIEDNQYFVNNGGDISLEEFPLNTDKIKFRTTNLVFPVHFEIGPSRKIERDDYFRYSTRKQLKFGFGGYAGFNIGTLQKIKYDDENGNRTKDKFKGGYDTSNLVYGLSSYIAFGSTALYFKYDLNPIFKNQAVEHNNISLGFRFDMD